MKNKILMCSFLDFTSETNFIYFVTRGADQPNDSGAEKIIKGEAIFSKKEPAEMVRHAGSVMDKAELQAAKDKIHNNTKELLIRRHGGHRGSHLPLPDDLTRNEKIEDLAQDHINKLGRAKKHEIHNVVMYDWNKLYNALSHDANNAAAYMHDETHTQNLPDPSLIKVIEGWAEFYSNKIQNKDYSPPDDVKRSVVDFLTARDNVIYEWKKERRGTK